MSIIVTQVPKTTFYVNADNNFVNQVGSSTAPFQTVTAAVAAAVAAAQADVVIQIAAGDYSLQDFTLTQGKRWVINGEAFASTRLGNVTFQTTGDGGFFPVSSLAMRSIVAKALTIVDGPGGAATNAPTILEDVAIQGNITATGTGFTPLLMSGASTASSAISGQNVSSICFGNISIPNANVGLTNTQVVGTVAAQKIWLRGCQVTGAINGTTAIEALSSFIQSIQTTPATQLTIDEYTYARVLAVGSALPSVISAAAIWYKFTFTAAQIGAGGTFTIFSLPAKGMIHSVIAKPSAQLTPGTVKISVGITGATGKYIANMSVAGAVSDANFVQSSAGVATPISWVNATNILLTVGVTSGPATAGSLDVWIQRSFLP